MIQDLKFALRQLFKAPGFTLAAVIVLALGIGANTAVFSLVHTMFFAPPPYAKPQEVVQVFSQDKRNPKTYRGFSYPTYQDIRAQNTVFADVMSYNLAMIGLGQKGDTRRTFGDRAGQQLIVIGRLKSGLTPAAAKPALEGLAANLEKAFPVEQKDQTFTTTPISRFSVSTAPAGEGNIATIAPMLLGMAIVVL